jgi:hypothetical protein
MCWAAVILVGWALTVAAACEAAEPRAPAGRDPVSSYLDPGNGFGPDPAGREPGDRTESTETQRRGKHRILNTQDPSARGHPVSSRL